MDRRWLGLVFVIGSVAFLLKCLLALNTVGTNDVLTWESFKEVATGLGPAHLYEGPIAEREYPLRASIFNHPPLVALGLQWLSSLSEATAIPFRALLRITASLADAGTLLLVCLAVRKGVLTSSPLVLCAMAACPTSIMIAGFHGNTDAIMVFFLMASVYALEVWGSALVCGVFLGLAMEIKVVPVLLMPALFLYLTTWRDRIVCIGAALVSFTVPALAFTDSMGQVFRSIFGYGSLAGHWGSTWLWVTFNLPKLPWFAVLEKWFMIALLLAASAWMNAQGRRVPLYTQWGVLLFLFMFLTPGFGIQYLIWLVPWVVDLRTDAIVAHYVFSGLFVFIVYTYWCRGLPWYYANSYEGDWYGWMHIFQLLAWLSTLWVLWIFWQKLVVDPSQRGRAQAARLASSWR